MVYLLLVWLTFLAVVSSLFWLWKRHPSYGANLGPPLFPIIGSLPYVFLHRRRLYQWMCEELSKTPTSTLRVFIGSTHGIVTAHPPNVEHILKTNFPNYPKGQCLRELLLELLGEGIFNSDGESWLLQRKVASHEFTTHSLRDFLIRKVASEIKTRLYPILFSACKTQQAVDLQDLFLRFSFDTVCQFSLGVDPASLEASSHQHLQAFTRAFDRATAITANRFLSIPFFWKTKKALKIGSEKRLSESIACINEFAMSVTEKRKEELLQNKDDSHNDLLSRFMRMGGLTDSMLRDIVISFVLAGRDAVASALTFFTWLLCNHPHAEKAILEEIRTVTMERKGLRSCGEIFTLEELRRMHYLHAALSESMRLYAPVPSDCKHALQDDKLPDGTEVAKGCQVTFHIFSMGRMERLWGSDCLQFRPERWLNDAGIFGAESPYKYPVFQAGPRICLGKDFAYIQMKLIAAALLKEFTFRVCEGHDPQFKFAVNLRMTQGLPVTVARRLATL